MSGRVHDCQLSVEHRRIKRASKALVAAVGGTAEAGEIAALRQQRVSECTLPNTNAFFALDAVLGLEEEAKGSTGWPQVTLALARHHGFALLPLPQGALGDSSWHRSLGEVSREVGDVVGKVVLALADGEVEAAEIREFGIIEEIDDAIARLADLRGLCSGKLEPIGEAGKGRLRAGGKP